MSLHANCEVPRRAFLFDQPESSTADRRSCKAYDSFVNQTWDVFSIPTPPALVQTVPASADVLATAMSMLEVMWASRTSAASKENASPVAAALALAYDLEKNNLSREAAKQLMRFVELNARFNELSATNKLLFELDVEKLSSRALTGVVRATARMQGALPAWASAYRKAWRAIGNKGKNPQTMFVGMPAPAEDGVASSAN